MQILSSKMVKKETPASGKLLLSLKVTGSPSEFTKRLNTQTFWHQSKGKLHDEVGAKLLPTARAVPFDPSLGATPFLGATQAEEPVAKKLRTAARLRSFLLVLDMHSTTSKTDFSEQSRLIQVLTLRRWDVASSPTVSSYYVHIWLWYFYIILHIVLIYSIYCISYHIILHHLFFSKTFFPNMTTTITTVESTVS